MQRLQGWPLLLDAVVLLPQVRGICAQWEADVVALMHVWREFDLGG
jgi:hypothetical protein